MQRMAVRRHAGSKDSAICSAPWIAGTCVAGVVVAARTAAVIAGVTVLVFAVDACRCSASSASKAFLPQDDQSEFEISLRAPEGTSLEDTELLATRIASARARAGAGDGLHAGDRRIGRPRRRRTPARSTCG